MKQIFGFLPHLSPESKVSFCDRKVLSIHPSICHKLFTFSTSYSELLHACPPHETYHKPSSKGPGPEEVLLFFEVI